MSTVLITHASHDERGKILGGVPGDQSGQEVCTRSWYSRPWDFVIRLTDSFMRERLAQAMERAAANPHIGYNQLRRNTALAAARPMGYDPARITRDCDTDCSALVTLCLFYAGIPEAALYKQGNSATTSTLRARLAATGTVSVYSSREYVAKPDKLIRGDILLSEGRHVAVVTRGNHVNTVTDIAREVMAGQWGEGMDRRQRLWAAGYDYKAVQDEVNRLLGK